MMNIMRRICESMRSLGMRFAGRSRGDSASMTLRINVIRCYVEREIMLSRSSSSSRSEPITPYFTKLALIIRPRDRAICENPFPTRTDERTTLLAIIAELVMLATRITLVLFVTSSVLAFYLMTRIIYSKAFPGFLLRAIEFLGPTFIKLGQWASTRRDIFPEEICATLTRLQRHTSAHSWLYTKYLLEKTYGPEWKNLFVKFDRSEPIGSGCCAQIDMKLEAKNLVKFSKNFAGNVDVVFPSPIMDLTHKKILVESFHECSPISDYLDCEDRNFQRKLAKIGISAIFQMIFKDNFVHCDLHPGNILVEKSRVSQYPKFLSFLRQIWPAYFADKTRLVFLDCGLVASLDERGKKNLRDVFRSVARGDGEMAGEHIINYSGKSASDVEGFKKEIGRIVKSHLGSRLRLNEIKVGSVVAEFFDAIVRYKVRQDASFTSVILSMGIIEGIGRSLDPEIDIISELLPFLSRK